MHSPMYPHKTGGRSASSRLVYILPGLTPWTLPPESLPQLMAGWGRTYGQRATRGTRSCLRHVASRHGGRNRVKKQRDMSDTVLHTHTSPSVPGRALWKLNEAAETCRTHGCDVRNRPATPCPCMREPTKSRPPPPNPAHAQLISTTSSVSSGEDGGRPRITCENRRGRGSSNVPGMCMSCHVMQE